MTNQRAARSRVRGYKALMVRYLRNCWVALHDPVGAGIAIRLKRAKITYLEFAALMSLRESVRRIERESIKGAIVEAGVALGGSAILIAKTKGRHRPLHLHDTFGLIPAPSERDGEDVQRRYAEIADGSAVGIDGDPYYGYLPNLADMVRANMLRFGVDPNLTKVNFRPGLFDETLQHDRVALAHIDSDWYDSVSVCLERMWPSLAPGGVMILDDYEAWSGCREAVNDWLERNPSAIAEQRTRFQIRKPGSP